MSISTVASTPKQANRVAADLARFELLAHRTMVQRLEHIMDTVRLTPEQARDVGQELQERQRLVRHYIGRRSYLRNGKLT